MLDRSIIDEVRHGKLTYLGPDRLSSLYQCIDEIRTTQAPGDFLEFGIALGGSGICLARALDAGRRYLGFDVFGMIPPPSSADGEDVAARYDVIASGTSHGIGGDRYYGYVENLFDVVTDNFTRFGCAPDQARILLVKGRFEETLPATNVGAIALAHLDCDWYEPVSYCLDYVWPRLSPGGYIVIDDYNDWSGCRTATDEFLASRPGAELLRSSPHAVIRKPTD